MKTPPEILEKFESAALGLEYGTVTLTLSVKQGNLRYVVNREESFVYTKDELAIRNDSGVAEEMKGD